MIVIRLKEPDLAPVVAELMKGQGFQNQLKGDLSSPNKIKHIKILNPTGKEAEKIMDLKETSSRLKEVICDFDHARHALSGCEKGNFPSVHLDAHLFNETIKIFRDEESKFKALYPMPLAYLWRELSTITNPKELYQPLLNGIESVLAFIACLKICSLAEQATKFNPVITIFNKMMKNGVTAGEWREVILASVEKESNIIPELVTLLSGNENKLKEFTDKFLTYRNENAHGSGPRNLPEYNEKTKELKKTFLELYRALGFLIDYPLHCVDRIERQGNNEQFTLDIRRLVGDHNVIKPEKSDWSVDKDLPCNGLYFKRSTDLFVFLSPWLIFHECHDCGQWEVCFPSCYDKKSGVKYKGIRTGHISLLDKAYLDRLKAASGVTDAQLNGQGS